MRDEILTYEVRTFGCQMNVHDSQRLSGLLESAGYRPAAENTKADIIVFNTCAVRENAANRLYGNLTHLIADKENNPNMQIAVGGCLAQKDKDEVLKKAPWVDVVFGTHNLNSLPILLKRAKHNKQAEIEILDSLSVFPSSLPAKREETYSAWVSISIGCNNTCTFCIVPALRGKAVDRNPKDILAEIRTLVATGVSEVTLLGQNVNSYGTSFADTNLLRDRGAFAKLLRACGYISGLERLRFTAPHPAEFTDDVINAMAETDNICPQLHMPLQSGSDNILKLMRRSYRQKKFLNIIQKVRAKIPEAALTTDIIVGFPGETEHDFQETLKVVNEVKFSSAFTFQYSIRPGTPAASMPNQVPKETVQERYDRLIELQDKISWQENQKQVGKIVELLVTNEGRKNYSTSRLSGRAKDGRVVHFTANNQDIRAGDYVKTIITKAAPHHLIADTEILHHRKTKAGDLSSVRQENLNPTESIGVNLGIPKIKLNNFK